MVRVEPDGRVRASIGVPASGQGYETVIAQIVADELGLAPDGIDVQRGFDSATTPWLYLSGNYSNKFSVTDVGAVIGPARRVRDKVLRIAAHRLEVAATVAAHGARAASADVQLGMALLQAGFDGARSHLEGKLSGFTDAGYVTSVAEEIVRLTGQASASAHDADSLLKALPA